MRAAVTLLEVLLALALTAMVSVATAGWIGVQARAVTARVRQAEGLEAGRSLMRALDEDLRGVPAGVTPAAGVGADGRQLEVRTLACLPGDPRGLKTVIWRFADGRLDRMVDGRVRPVSARFAGVRFQADPDGALQVQVQEAPSGEWRRLASWRP